MKKLNDQIKKLLKRLSIREKVITLLFIFVVLSLWASNIIDRFSNLNAFRQKADQELIYQESRLEKDAFYAQELNRALERVDPSKTYSAIQLSGRIDSLLRRAALASSSNIDPVKSVEGEIFNDHNITVELDRISITQLINFHTLVSAETPYINLQSLILKANRNNPEELNARFKINSFELINQNPQS
ncbi:MAG: hypothetical protein AAGH40_00420 [Verrucomicrobiota bacterium]